MPGFCWMLCSILVLGMAGCADSRPGGPVAGDATDDHEARITLTDRVHGAIQDSSLRVAVMAALQAVPEFPDSGCVDSVVALLAADMGIESLEGVSLLRNLQALDVSGNAIVDVTPLAALRDLRMLNLSDNQVRSVEPLGQVQSLRVLVLDWNEIARIDELAALEHLASLSLAGNPVAGGEETLAAVAARGTEITYPEGYGETDEPEPEGPGPSLQARLVAADMWAVSVASDGSWYGLGRCGASGGLPCVARSPDRGVTWEVLADSSGWPDLLRGAHLISTAGEDPVNLLVHSLMSWYRSEDGGKTWEMPRGLAYSAWEFTRSPVIVAVLDDVCWLGEAGDRGYTLSTNRELRTTTNGGGDWRNVAQPVHAFALGRLTGELFVSDHGHLSRSVDGGDTFRQILALDGCALALEAYEDGTQRLLVGTQLALQRLNYSTGEVEDLLEADPEWSAMRVRMDPRSQERILVVTGGSVPSGYNWRTDGPPFDHLARELWYSADSGRRWARIEIEDPRDVVFDGDGTVVAATDQGLYRLE